MIVLTWCPARLATLANRSDPGFFQGKGIPGIAIDDRCLIGMYVYGNVLFIVSAMFIGHANGEFVSDAIDVLNPRIRVDFIRIPAGIRIDPDNTVSRDDFQNRIAIRVVPETV